MKKFFGYFTLLSLLFPPAATFAQDDDKEEMIYYTDEDDDLFNRGRFVGAESDEYIRRERRIRNRNWSIALGTTAIGIAALVFTASTHDSHH